MSKPPKIARQPLTSRTLEQIAAGIDQISTDLDKIANLFPDGPQTVTGRDPIRKQAREFADKARWYRQIAEELAKQELEGFTPRRTPAGVARAVLDDWDSTKVIGFAHTEAEALSVAQQWADGKEFVVVRMKRLNSFTLYEADGNTPADIERANEAASAWMIAETRKLTTAEVAARILRARK